MGTGETSMLYFIEVPLLRLLISAWALLSDQLRVLTVQCMLRSSTQ